MKSLLACLCWSLLLATAGTADYGKKVTFTKGAPLVFPDCELTFTGTHRVASPVYARGFLYYDFTVSAGGKTRAISWSSGTGDIGPEIFSINGRSFVLELGFAKGIKGPLKENELVLRPEQRGRSQGGRKERGPQIVRIFTDAGEFWWGRRRVFRDTGFQVGTRRQAISGRHFPVGRAETVASP